MRAIARKTTQSGGVVNRIGVVMTNTEKLLTQAREIAERGLGDKPSEQAVLEVFRALGYEMDQARGADAERRVMH